MTDMGYMFYGAAVFNQPIGTWIPPGDEHAAHVYLARVFNQDIGHGNFAGHKHGQRSSTLGVRPRHRSWIPRGGEHEEMFYATSSTKISARGTPPRSRHGPHVPRAIASTRIWQLGHLQVTDMRTCSQRRVVQPGHQLMEIPPGDGHEVTCSKEATAFYQDITGWTTTSLTTPPGCSPAPPRGSTESSARRNRNLRGPI